MPKIPTEPTPNELPGSYYHMKSEITAMLEAWDTELERYEIDTSYITKRTGVSLLTISKLRNGKAKLQNMTFVNVMKLYNLAKYCRNVGKFTAETRMKLGQERPAIPPVPRKYVENYKRNREKEREQQQLELEKNESEGTPWTP